MFWRRNDRDRRPDDLLDRLIATPPSHRQAMLESAVAAGSIRYDEIAGLLRTAARLESVDRMTVDGWAAAAVAHEPELAVVTIDDGWRDDLGLVGIAIEPETEPAPEAETAVLVGDTAPLPGADRDAAIDYAARMRYRRRAALVRNSAARARRH